MEIKGLAQSVKRAREGIAQLREASQNLDGSTTALIQSMTEVKAQVDAMHADLKFEAETLGNSPPADNSPPSAGIGLAPPKVT